MDHVTLNLFPQSQQQSNQNTLNITTIRPPPSSNPPIAPNNSPSLSQTTTPTPSSPNAPLNNSLSHLQNHNLICLVIPIELPPHLLRDTYINLPQNDANFYQLTNLYESYLHYPSTSSGQTLCWINLLRGLLNNATWTSTCAIMMHEAATDSVTSIQTRNLLLNLQTQNLLMIPPPRSSFQAHPLINFPLSQFPVSWIVRPVPQPLLLSHVPLHCRGTIINIYGESLTLLTSPTPQNHPTRNLCSLLSEIRKRHS